MTDEQIVTPDQRRLFDQALERVLTDLPPQVHELLDEMPLIVEDYPSDDVMDYFDLKYLDQLCGLHQGIPLTHRSVQHSGTLPEKIIIYREGILNTSTDAKGRVNEPRLLKQIRVTVLHEIGHHFGLDEDDLRELGYG